MLVTALARHFLKSGKDWGGGGGGGGVLMYLKIFNLYKEMVSGFNCNLDIFINLNYFSIYV